MASGELFKETICNIYAFVTYTYQPVRRILGVKQAEATCSKECAVVCAHMQISSARDLCKVNGSNNIPHFSTMPPVIPGIWKRSARTQPQMYPIRNLKV